MEFPTVDAASEASIKDFLKGLPSYNRENFSMYSKEHGGRVKRPSIYLPTEDSPSEQHIVMDKRCVLLHYLTQQWDKKQLPKKREHNGSDTSSPTLGLSNNGGNSCKKRRTDPNDAN